MKQVHHPHFTVKETEAWKLNDLLKATQQVAEPRITHYTIVNHYATVASSNTTDVLV